MDQTDDKTPNPWTDAVLRMLRDDVEQTLRRLYPSRVSEPVTVTDNPVEHWTMVGDPLAEPVTLPGTLRITRTRMVGPLWPAAPDPAASTAAIHPQHYADPVAVSFSVRAADPFAPFPGVDPLAPAAPVPYSASAGRQARTAVFSYRNSARQCTRCARPFTDGLAVVVRRPGLPSETIHITDLEDGDQVEPRPE